MTTQPQSGKYRPVTPLVMTNRQWPARTQQKAPRWCSVDLRDGNQALPEPMSPGKNYRCINN